MQVTVRFFLALVLFAFASGSHSQPTTSQPPGGATLTDPGGAPPATLKVCVNELGGYRNSAEFLLVGLDIEAKAEWLRAQVEAALSASTLNTSRCVSFGDRITSSSATTCPWFSRVTFPAVLAFVPEQQAIGAAADPAQGVRPVRPA